MEILDAAEMAASAGLTGTSEVKKWKKKLDDLAALGFVRIKGKSEQRYCDVLLLHPHDVVQRIHRESPERMPSSWWGYFQSRIHDIGARLERRAKPASRAAAAKGASGPRGSGEGEFPLSFGAGPLLRKPPCVRKADGNTPLAPSQDEVFLGESGGLSPTSR